MAVPYAGKTQPANYIHISEEKNGIRIRSIIENYYPNYIYYTLTGTPTKAENTHFIIDKDSGCSMYVIVKE